MRIAICDDLEEARKKTAEALRTVVRELSITEFDDGKELLRAHAFHPFDLIVLDILMPNMNGMEIAAELRKNDTDTPVIFLSESDEFGVESYRVFAFDYLLKPIDPEQLKLCMKRLFARFKKKDYITVTYSGTETNILLSNILYLESNLRKVIFTLSGNRRIEVTGKLSDFEGALTAHGFCRCHKSYIVNMEHIDSIGDNAFVLTDGKTVKISRAYMHSAKKAYFDYVFSAEPQ